MTDLPAEVYTGLASACLTGLRAAIRDTRRRGLPLLLHAGSGRQVPRGALITRCGAIVEARSVRRLADVTCPGCLRTD